MLAGFGGFFLLFFYCFPLLFFITSGLLANGLRHLYPCCSYIEMLIDMLICHVGFVI